MYIRKNDQKKKFTTKIQFCVFSTLLESKVEANVQDICGKTALHFACDWKYMPGNSKQRNNQMAITNLLLENSPDLMEIQAKNGEYEGMTALHLASRRGNPDIVRLDIGAIIIIELPSIGSHQQMK